ncbi:MAG: hypothetical protein GC168_01305 [Candidatus Hydrogenedens sp.]|nr:hypothetical protein [Candidatus Hydrogenedens sp.]
MYEREIALAKSADLLVLPELALTGYDIPDLEALARLSEPFGEGPTSTWLVESAAKYNTTLVCGYSESAGEKFYNSAMVALPSGELHNYRKIHLYSREKDLFAHGEERPLVCETPAGKVGVMICFDWFFPEVARCLAIDGADIIAHPANLVLPWCQDAMFARSIENRVYTITANRIGKESQAGRTLTFTGRSQVMSTRGVRLSEAPTDQPHTGLAKIELDEASNKRINAHNDLFEDRKPGQYASISGKETFPAS